MQSGDKHKDTESNAISAKVGLSKISGSEIHTPQFIAARDSRKRKIPGLYTRNGRFYGLLWADRGDGKKTARRFPLLDEDDKPIRDITAARDALVKLKADSLANALPQAGVKPAFDSFVAQYLQMAVTRQKKQGTQERDRNSLTLWLAHIGPLRVDRIGTPIIKTFVEMRLAGCKLAGKTYKPAHPRTVSLDMISLRNLLKAALDAGYLRELPRFPRVRVPPPPRRTLLKSEEFDKLQAACLALNKEGERLTKNGEQLRDFLRFLAFTGAREKEALCLKWAHVDFEGRRVFIGANEDFNAAGHSIGTGGTSKNRGSRAVDFNTQLETLLCELHARRAPDSSWLFPSPQRGAKDIPARSLRESLRLVRAHAELPTLGFHDLRHLFCSFSVMAGIDFMTIAAWLGHKDGGILVGKVYGHLMDKHRQDMAARLTIGTPAAAKNEM